MLKIKIFSMNGLEIRGDRPLTPRTMNFCNNVGMKILQSNGYVEVSGDYYFTKLKVEEFLASKEEIDSNDCNESSSTDYSNFESDISSSDDNDTSSDNDWLNEQENYGKISSFRNEHNFAKQLNKQYNYVPGLLNYYTLTKNNDLLPELSLIFRCAAAAGDIETCKTLLDQIGTLRVGEIAPASGRTALHLAVIHQHYKLIAFLLTYGADILKKDINNKCPLDYCAESNHYLIKKLPKFYHRIHKTYRLAESENNVPAIFYSYGHDLKKQLHPEILKKLYFAAVVAINAGQEGFYNDKNVNLDMFLVCYPNILRLLKKSKQSKIYSFVPLDYDLSEEANLNAKEPKTNSDNCKIKCT